MDRALAKNYHGEELLAIGVAVADSGGVNRPTAILPFDRERSILILYNDGAQDVYITFDNTTSEGKIKIPAGQGLILKDPAPTNAIYAYTASSTTALSVISA